MFKHLKTLCAAAIVASASAIGANAAIVSATGATINSNGPGFGSINDTFNQAGLNSNYISGVTDFDTFVAGVSHSYIFAGNEWFSNQGTNTASVTYDLGMTRTINKMALWNDEASGIGVLDLLVSNDGVSFSNLALGLTPTDNPQNVDYNADVFGFAATAFRYIRLDMSRCPQADNIFNACAIGEVAFNDVTNGVIPLPGGAVLLLSALGGFGLARRRRTKVS